MDIYIVGHGPLLYTVYTAIIFHRTPTSMTKDNPPCPDLAAFVMKGEFQDNCFVQPVRHT